MANLDLAPDDLLELRSILARCMPQAEIWAYGSRVVGGAHEGSDLDLVVRSQRHGPQATQIAELRDALSESNLTILVDVLDWARVPDSFRREIEKAHVVVQVP